MAASRIPPKPISSRLAVRLMDVSTMMRSPIAGAAGIPDAIPVRNPQMKMLVGPVVGLPADCRCCCSKKESEPQSNPKRPVPVQIQIESKQPKRNTPDGRHCNRKVEGSEGQEAGWREKFLVDASLRSPGTRISCG